MWVYTHMHIDARAGYRPGNRTGIRAAGRRPEMAEQAGNYRGASKLLSAQLEAEMAELVRVWVCTHMHIAGDIGPGFAYRVRRTLTASVPVNQPA